MSENYKRDPETGSLIPESLYEQRLLAKILAAQNAAKEAVTPEFQQQYESLLGGVGTRDANMIRLHAPDDLNLKGYAITPENTEEELQYLKERYEPHGLTVEPNTVNAVGKSNMRPETIAHEFRHLQAPDMPESINRLADAAVAQNAPQWEDAVRMVADGRKVLPSETLGVLYRDLDTFHANAEYDRQYKLGARPKEERPWWKEVIDEKTLLRDERKAGAMWPKEMEAYDHYVDWNKGIKDRNAAIIEELRKEKQ